MIRITFNPETGVRELYSYEQLFGSALVYKQNFSNEVVWNIQHNKTTKNILIFLLDETGQTITDGLITIVDENNIQVINTSAKSGIAYITYQNY